jgi:D-alanyl-D-alanine carboxypeptidase
MKLRPLSKLSIGILLFSAAFFGSAQAPAALKSSAITPILKSAASSKSLANPGMVLIDPVTGETLFENSASSLRKPASLLKLLSATALLNYLTPEHRFVTELYKGYEPNSLIIAGSLDPWMERNNSVATKMNRVSLPKIYKAAIKKLDADNGAPIKNVTISYANFYTADLAILIKEFKSRNIKVTTTKISTKEVGIFGKESFAKFESPKLQTIMDWMLLWSDNTLGDRMATYASMKAGYGYQQSGIEKVFIDTLTNLGIDSTGLNAVDGSGLSKANRVSANLIGQLLLKTYRNEKYQSIYGGLPIGGVNGTLRSRFVESAPSAVGLIRAKTGTLNGTISLAGYVQGGDREYIFVAIADQIPLGNYAANAARKSLDKVVAKFALPLIVPSPSPSPETSPSPLPNPSASASAVVENLYGAAVTSNPSS